MRPGPRRSTHAYQECLPKAGLKVLDHIRFNPDTTDFTPIFHSIEAKHPDVIITGISHVGVQPTVQWHDQQVPIADGRPKLAGHHQHVLEGHQRRRRRRDHRHRRGARRGSDADRPSRSPTPTSSASASPPSYDGYSELRRRARHRRGDEARPARPIPTRWSTAMEKTDYVGTIGRVQFYGRDDQFTHAMKYGTGLSPASPSSGRTASRSASGRRRKAARRS